MKNYTVNTITIAQAIVAIVILRDEANGRILQYRGAGEAYVKAVLEWNAYQTVLNILSNVK